MNAHHADGIPTLIAVETDGVTLVNIQADPTTHELYTSDGSTGSDNGPANSFHDGSHVPVLIATSNGDGKTPKVIYGDTNGKLLIEST